jgi:hypothetical protein
MLILDKTKLLLLPFFIGLALMIVAWYTSYPLSASFANDYVYNHISVLYWFGLPLLSSSMFLMAVTTKNSFLKWALSIGIVLTFFALAYFYSMMPTSDSQSFRALMEYFTKTRNLDPSQLNHNYYQWPAFFILAYVVTSVSGLPLAAYEFLLYAIIGALLATGLYVYASKKNNLPGFIVVIAFFMSITYFIDYQAVPFSLALGLLFLLLMLETRQKSAGLIITMVVLYAGLLLTHLFVPLFFILYLLVHSLLDKNRQSRNLYLKFFLFAFVSYFLVELTMARFSFAQIMANITRTPSVSSLISTTAAISSVANPISVYAQFFSRTVTVAIVLVCVAGSAFLLRKGKMGVLDKAIFVTGVSYTLLGLVLNTLGERAIALLFIPFSLGAAYLFTSKFKKYFIGILLVLLVLFLFVPLHLAFNTEIQFQTRETYVADNFFLNHYNWGKPGFVVTDFRTNTYLTAKLGVTENIESWLEPGQRADAILYTPQFVGLALGNYTSMASLAQGERLSLVYNDGSSYVLINNNR